MEDTRNMYNQLAATDILDPIANHLRNGRFVLEADGRITERKRVDFEKPWIVPVVDMERNCSKWFSVYFNIYKIIPRGCRNCWKIGFHPRTLEDLFKILRIQESMVSVCSKSGLERRALTGHKGGYSSFWYTPLNGGIERGREIYTSVKKLLQDRLGYSDGLILKRGCTEMEQFTSGLFGGSEAWDSRAEVFDLTEQLLDSVFDLPELYERQMPKLGETHIKRGWIEWAFEHGDLTYLKYTDGKSLAPPLFNYALKENQGVNPMVTWEGEANDSRSSKILSIV